MTKTKKLRPPIKIHGFEGYEITTEGEVFTYWRFRGCGYGATPTWYIGEEKRLLKHDIDDRGRHRVRLRKFNNKYVKKFVHVLVLENFVGPKPHRHQGCHGDGDTSNNRLSNLRWDTARNNHADKHKHKTMPIGSRHSKSKLTEAQVLEIRHRVDQGEFCTVLAAEHGVSPAAISYVVLGNTWKHVGGPIQK